MRAGEVEPVLMRIGRVFIAGLVLQPRISGQAVLLPFFGGLMIWSLLALRPVVVSTEGRRGFRITLGAAAVVTGLGILGWLGVEPGGLSMVVLMAFITSVLGYAAFVRGWCERTGWTEAATHFRRARTNLSGVAVATSLALFLVVVFADERTSGAPDPPWWSLVAGRTVGNGWVIGFFVLVFIGWVGASIELERGSKALRGALTAVAADLEAPAPVA